MQYQSAFIYLSLNCIECFILVHLNIFDKMQHVLPKIQIVWDSAHNELDVTLIARLRMTENDRAAR